MCVVHEEISYRNHLIALVRHKEVQIFYFSKFSITLLTHSLMRSVKRNGKLARATASLLWWKCLEFCGKKNFSQYQMPTCMYYSLTVLTFMVAIATKYGYHQRSCKASRITTGFPHHIIMHPDR